MGRREGWGAMRTSGRGVAAWVGLVMCVEG